MADANVEPKPSPPAILPRWVPSLPTNLISNLNPFANDAAPSSKDESSTATSKRTSLFGGIFPVLSTSSNTASSVEPPSPGKDDDVSMFAEPDARSNSDASREGSVDEVGRRRNSRKSMRPKTSFSICHPPPASTKRQRLHRRPRSLLQLHKLSTSARPQPAFEVIPSANFSVRMTKAITKVYKAKHSLCASDLVVLEAEKYAMEDTEDEEQEARGIVALICRGKKEEGGAPVKARICLPDGRDWEAYPLVNGGYEFASIDEHGLELTARWVPKKNKDGTRPSIGEARKFNFSTISPNCRRHPVIAALSRTGLDINDTYKMPEPAGATPLNTPKQSSTILTDTMEEENDEFDDEYHETDFRLRELILLTSIWVLFKENWSPNFKYDDKDCFLGVQRSPSMSMPQSPSRSSTLITPVSTPPASPGLVPTEKRSSIRSMSNSILRPQSLLGRGGNRASQGSLAEMSVATLDSSSNNDLGHRTRSRTNSQSTVLVHRAASNRRKNNESLKHQATWRPDLLAQQQQQTAGVAGSVYGSEDGDHDHEEGIPVGKGRRGSLAAVLEQKIQDTGPGEEEEGEETDDNNAEAGETAAVDREHEDSRQSNATSASTAVASEAAAPTRQSTNLARNERGRSLKGRSGRNPTAAGKTKSSSTNGIENGLEDLKAKARIEGGGSQRKKLRGLRRLLCGSA